MSDSDSAIKSKMKPVKLSSAQSFRWMGVYSESRPTVTGTEVGRGSGSSRDQEFSMRTKEKTVLVSTDARRRAGPQGSERSLEPSVPSSALISRALLFDDLCDPLT